MAEGKTRLGRAAREGWEGEGGRGGATVRGAGAARGGRRAVGPRVNPIMGAMSARWPGERRAGRGGRGATRPRAPRRSRRRGGARACGHAAAEATLAQGARGKRRRARRARPAAHGPRQPAAGLTAGLRVLVVVRARQRAGAPHARDPRRRPRAPRRLRYPTLRAARARSRSRSRSRGGRPAAVPRCRRRRLPHLSPRPPRGGAVRPRRGPLPTPVFIPPPTPRALPRQPQSHAPRAAAAGRRARARRGKKRARTFAAPIRPRAPGRGFPSPSSFLPSPGAARRPALPVFCFCFVLSARGRPVGSAPRGGPPGPRPSGGG